MEGTKGLTRRRLTVLGACLALLISVVVPPAALAVSPAEEELAGATGDTARVIVTFRGRPGRAERAAVQAEGGTIGRTFTIIDAVAAEMPAGRMNALRKNPLVERVEIDATMRTFEHPSSPYNLEYANAWGVDHIGARRAHETGGTRGAGVGVAVIDTGLDYVHDVPPSGEPPVVDPEFLGNYAGGIDIFNGDADPMDDNGHGTHVSGSLAAELNGYLVAGVAPEVDLYAVKILDANGEGQYSHLIAGLEWVVDYNAAHPGAIDVVNMSVGAHEQSQALADAVANAYGRGLILVAAAGNVNPLDFWELWFGCPVAYPAAYPQVFATTYTNEQDNLTGFSCTGVEVDFAAPGDNIASTVPVGSCMFCSDTGYNFLSGTSMASPHLAGAVALVLSKGIADGNGNGHLGDDVKSHLCANTTPGATPPTPANYAKWYGCGVVSAGKAIVDDPPTPPGGTNNPPDAVNDTVTVVEDGSGDVAVLTNDTDADGDTLTVTAVGAATKGTVTNLGAGLVRYTPNPNATGADSFNYTISDGQGGSDTATVTVTITAVNDIPAANPTSVSTPHQTAVAVTLSGSDVETCELTFSVVAGPANGGVGPLTDSGCAPGSPNTDSAAVTYTPNADFSGSDSFTYRVNDGSADSAAVTVSITVGSPSGPPPATSVHVGDLDGSTAKGSKNWKATVTITIHDSNEAPVSGATVTGKWSIGSGSASCTTNASGLCTLTRTISNSKTSVTFTVTTVSATLPYASTSNHDPDGDSNGTVISIPKPV